MAHSDNFSPRDRDRHDSNDELFRTIEFKESRHRSLWMSLSVHGVLLTVLLLVPLIFTDAIKIKYYTVLIAPPPPPLKPLLEVTHYKLPQAKPQPKLEKPLVAPPPAKPLVIQPPKPKPPEPPKVVEAKPPEPVVRNITRLEQPAPTPAAPKLEVRTGAFSTSSSAKPTTNLPPAQVQTGGFGDPNGIKGDGKPGKVANIASLGSFDLPVGTGAGNGAGGANGVKGTIVSAGFGSGVATTNSSSGSGANRTVRQGGFGDAEPVKSDATKKRADAGTPQTPVEILFKPKPEYTDEARKMKIEGEVLVRALFTAGGEVRVLDVIRGLGHGLDQTAVRAAQQIKFKPSQRDGQPVDSTATVHIVFQLAY
jgi:TonB family protein